jgi:hypothetical protein
MSISLYDPARQQFISVDGGQIATGVLLLNILIELRVHSLFLKEQNHGRCHDELAEIRNNLADDPQSLTGGMTFTKT